jgi:hypothetical protein
MDINPCEDTLVVNINPWAWGVFFFFII